MRDTKIKIIIAAGGSGGHIFPAVALAKALRERHDIGILFIGGKRELDKRIFEKESFCYELLSNNKLVYRNKCGFPVFFLKLLFDLIRAFFIIKRYGPSVVVGFGGYLSFPIVIAGRILNVPCVIHEQNVVPGRANRSLTRLANKIALSFKESAKYLGNDARKAVFTGNPIRREILRDDHLGGLRKFAFVPDKFTVLVIGGSQGAHRLNELFIDAIGGMDRELVGDLQIIHLTGVQDYNWAIERYRAIGVDRSVNSFIDRIEEAYGASNLIVTRSGASALFEAAYFGRPMILVPYPHAGNHQRENARIFADRGAAILLEEPDLTADKFRDAIVSFMRDKGMIAAMSTASKKMAIPAAADNLASLILELS